MPRKRHYVKSDYSPKSLDQIRQITRDFRRRVGVDDQRSPDIWVLLLKLPELYPRFKKKIVADDDRPHVEAKAYCDAFLLKIRESSENALKYFGDPRTRFTVAHELGHLILGHPGNNPRLALGDDNGTILIDPELEREANIFASELLMPFHLVEPSMTKGEISRLFQVSLDTAAIRIHELGLDTTDQSKLPVPLPGQRTRAPSNPPQISRPGVFVSMAYSPVMNRLYAEIFKPTIESLGMQALRADEIASVEPISLDIRRSRAMGESW
jgi:hypothetical protein